MYIYSKEKLKNTEIIGSKLLVTYLEENEEKVNRIKKALDERGIYCSYCGKYGEDNFCFQNFEETKKCPINNYPCALNNAPDIENFPECVVLNTTMEDALINKDEITIIVPLHKVNGTCFKMYIELTDSKQTDRLYALLDELGLMLGCAKSGNTRRVYFSLPDSTWNGVFRLKDIFSNNFLCPGILD